jgi:hypothetical protein
VKRDEAPRSRSCTQISTLSDGRALLFSYYDKTTPGTIMRKSLAGSTMPERIDGRYVVARLNPAGQTASDIWMRVLGRSAATSVLSSLVARFWSAADIGPRPFLQSNANESGPSFSPGSDWLAYESDETRRYEVYIQSFPTAGRKYQASIDGGRIPGMEP